MFLPSRYGPTLMRRPWLVWFAIQLPSTAAGPAGLHWLRLAMHPLSHGCQAPSLGAAAFPQVAPDARAAFPQVENSFSGRHAKRPRILEGNEDTGPSRRPQASG